MSDAPEWFGWNGEAAKGGVIYDSDGRRVISFSDCERFAYAVMERCGLAENGSVSKRGLQKFALTQIISQTLEYLVEILEIDPMNVQYAIDSVEAMKFAAVASTIGAILGFNAAAEKHAKSVRP